MGRGLWLVLTLERKGSEREGFKEAAAMERSGNGLHSGMVVRGEGDGELVELEGGGGRVRRELYRPNPQIWRPDLQCW